MACVAPRLQGSSPPAGAVGFGLRVSRVVSRRRGSPFGPHQAAHVVGEVGERGRGRGARHADAPDDEVHAPLLGGEDMLEEAAHPRSPRLPAGDVGGHRPAARLDPLEARPEPRRFSGSGPAGLASVGDVGRGPVAQCRTKARKTASFSVAQPGAPPSSPVPPAPRDAAAGLDRCARRPQPKFGPDPPLSDKSNPDFFR